MGVWNVNQLQKLLSPKAKKLKKSGLTYQEIAARLGISKAGAYIYVNGRK